MDPEILEALRRGSEIRLTREGTFRYRAGAVENPRVQALFHRGIAVRPDGDVTLSVGRMWCYVTCDGVARFAESMRFGADTVVVRLRGAEQVEVEIEAIGLGYAPDHRVYLWLKDVVGPALLMRAAHQAVMGKLGEDLVLRTASGQLKLVELDAVPGPAAEAPIEVGAPASEE